MSIEARRAEILKIRAATYEGLSNEQVVRLCDEWLLMLEALDFISKNLGYQSSPPFPAPIVFAADEAREALQKISKGE